MAVFLLDTNMLVALAWPNHVHHQTAHQWFASLISDQWATCPITQCGLVRISSNPKILADALSPKDAIVLLEKMVAHPTHTFWSDNVSLCGPSDFPSGALQGHQQVTDAYLLALCLHNKGQLATLDQGVMSLAQNDRQRAAIIVISN